MHWCLATIDLKSKGVFYYDSMGGDNTDCLDALLRYLQVTSNIAERISPDAQEFESQDIIKSFNFISIFTILLGRAHG